MKRNKIPTLLALVILLIGLTAGVILIRSQRFFQPEADSSFAPKDVRITNINDSSFNVSWVTEKELQGFVKWGTSGNSLNKSQETDNPNGSSFTHSVTISALSPGTNYYFSINSGGDLFDNNGNPWQVVTAVQPGNGESQIASGTVVDASEKPFGGALVYLTVGGGSPLSTTTSANGTWVVPVSTIYSVGLNSFVQVSSDTLIDIFVNAGPAGVASAKVLPEVAKKTPPIVLGKTLDFRNLSANNGSDAPNATLELPETETPSSKFNLGDLSPNENNASVDSIVQGEVINTTKPEFFGSAPKNTNITVKIESQIIIQSIKVDENGKWNFAVQGELEPGTHKITVTWKDSNGILQTLTKTFVVMAAEGPAFEASTSATPTSSPTNSPTSSPTLSPRPTLTSTPTLSPTLTPTPTDIADIIPTETPADGSLLDTGSLTPTILLFIMGIGTMLLGILVWKHSDA